VNRWRSVAIRFAGSQEVGALSGQPEVPVAHRERVFVTGEFRLTCCDEIRKNDHAKTKVVAMPNGTFDADVRVHACHGNGVHLPVAQQILKLLIGEGTVSMLGEHKVLRAWRDD
jgi:hypothetical protein